MPHNESGTVMLVSHDRALQRAACDEFWRVSRGEVRALLLKAPQWVWPIFHGMAARDRLTLACNGDRQKAEWLMAYEYQLASEIDDEEAAQRAWQR